MGDVALTLPVLRGFLNTYTNSKITIVTRKNFSPFFENIERLEIFSPDFSGRHKGFFGIFRLFHDLQKIFHPDYIIDLHSVLRTHILCLFYRIGGIPSKKLFKERKKKNAALKLPGEPGFIHSTERYCNVFSEAGFNFEIASGNLFGNHTGEDLVVHQFISSHTISNLNFIGIAPFAKHNLKIYPEQKLYDLVRLLSDQPFEIFLFGGGKTEIEKLTRIAGKFINAHVVRLNLSTELELIKKLRLMISMDSANMHMAALAGIPVISIWGATHPGMGFAPVNQPSENSIQIPVSKLDCRPCTIYGKGECRRGDFACMNLISAEQIMQRVMEIISPNHQGIK